MIAEPTGATHISLKAPKHKHHCYYKILYVEIGDSYIQTDI